MAAGKKKRKQISDENNENGGAKSESNYFGNQHKNANGQANGPSLADYQQNFDADNSFKDSQLENYDYQMMSDERRHDDLSKSARIDQIHKVYSKQKTMERANNTAEIGNSNLHLRKNKSGVVNNNRFSEGNSLHNRMGGLGEPGSGGVLLNESRIQARDLEGHVHIQNMLDGAQK